MAERAGGETTTPTTIHSDGYLITTIAFGLLLLMLPFAKDQEILPLEIPVFTFMLGCLGLFRANWVAAALLAFPAW